MPLPSSPRLDVFFVVSFLGVRPVLARRVWACSGVHSLLHRHIQSMVLVFASSARFLLS